MVKLNQALEKETLYDKNRNVTTGFEQKTNVYEYKLCTRIRFRF